MCLDDATALAVLEWRVSPGVALEIDAHVDACASCAQLLATLGKMAAGEGRLGESPEESGEEEDLHEGVAIGRYVIERPLGRGGMGVVYEARDPELRRRVAIKVLRSGTHESPRATERIKREARVMARLVHPNVVTVYDVGQHGSRVYIVMELVEGTNLRAWLLREPRSVGEILEVFASAGRGLAAAHGEELVHRDFKPDNVLLQLDRASGRVTRIAIADFGLASDALASVTITGPTNLLGTPAYMAPEQRRGAPTTAHADQFSFCLALEEALTSVPPRAVPRRVREAIARGLSRDPQDRHRSMTELAEILESSRAGEPRRWPRVAVAALGAVALAGLGLGVVFARMPTPSAATSIVTATLEHAAMVPREPVAPAPPEPAAKATPEPPAKATAPEVPPSPPRVGKASSPKTLVPRAEKALRIPASSAPKTPRSNEDI